MAAHKIKVVGKGSNVGNSVEMEKENERLLGKEILQVSEEMIVFNSPLPLKTISAGVTGAGMGSYDKFVNRHVDKNYDCRDYRKDMIVFLKERNFAPEETVSMMTAVHLNQVIYEEWEGNDFSILVVVTAGSSNAVDASLGKSHAERLKPGTINTWVFVNGKITDGAFIQAIITATEAKTKALSQAKILDPVTHTLATGTTTDNILIAASQQGRELEFAGPISELGALVGRAVFICTKKALEKAQQAH